MSRGFSRVRMLSYSCVKRQRSARSWIIIRSADSIDFTLAKNHCIFSTASNSLILISPAGDKSRQWALHTCKLTVAVAPVTKLGDQFAIELEDENAAGFVVYHNYVAVSVHRDTLGTHQLARADLVLEAVDKKWCYITPLLRIDIKNAAHAKFLPTVCRDYIWFTEHSAPREINRRRSRTT